MDKEETLTQQEKRGGSAYSKGEISRGGLSYSKAEIKRIKQEIRANLSISEIAKKLAPEFGRTISGLKNRIHLTMKEMNWNHAYSQRVVIKNKPEMEDTTSSEEPKPKTGRNMFLMDGVSIEFDKNRPPRKIVFHTDHFSVYYETDEE